MLGVYIHFQSPAYYLSTVVVKSAWSWLRMLDMEMKVSRVVICPKLLKSSRRLPPPLLFGDPLPALYWAVFVFVLRFRLPTRSRVRIDVQGSYASRYRITHFFFLGRPPF